MGLFDSVFGGQKADEELSKHEAFAGILMGAVASDGYISDEEARGLCTTLARMKLYESWSPERFNKSLNRLMGIHKRGGNDVLLKKCAENLPDELRETAFANACDLILADGVVESEEKKFLEELRSTLRISGDQALTIVQVMIVKNRG